VSHDGGDDVTAEARRRPAEHPPDRSWASGRPTSDQEWFVEIYDRYFPAIYRYVAGRLGVNAAEDVTADTFLVAFRKQAGFDPARGAVRPWLYGIATTQVAQHRREEARWYRRLGRAVPEPDAGSHENHVIDWVTAEGLRGRLAAAIGELSRGDRDVLLLVALGGLRGDEVAEALSLPAGTVRSRLNRARKKIRKALGETDLMLGEETDG
jgi:RNA polymerase sigma-70 factor (ECF subfamily)